MTLSGTVLTTSDSLLTSVFVFTMLDGVMFFLSCQQLKKCMVNIRVTVKTIGWIFLFDGEKLEEPE